jgi:hypothetical protein
VALRAALLATIGPIATEDLMRAVEDRSEAPAELGGATRTGKYL